MRFLPWSVVRSGKKGGMEGGMESLINFCCVTNHDTRQPVRPYLLQDRKSGEDPEPLLAPHLFVWQHHRIGRVVVSQVLLGASGW